MFKKQSYETGLAFMMAVFVLPFPFTYTLNQTLTASDPRLAIFSGVFAYVWMLLAIYIGTRPQWLDRWIGLPMAYMIHGILSLVAIFFAIFHKENAPSFGLAQQTGQLGFMIFFGIGLYSMIFMAGWLTSRIPLLGKIKKNLEAFFKHEISLWLHRLNLLATFLIFVHVNAIDYIRSNIPFMIIFWAASLFVAISYINSKLNPQSKGQLAKLISNKELAPNTRELTIQFPDKRQLKAQAGDFVFISFPQIKGLSEPHPFSLVNDPKLGTQAVLAIRGDGDFTRQLAEVQAPTKIRITDGYGLYQQILDKHQSDNFFMISGGIGITPFLSIIDAHPQTATQVFHSAINENSLLYPDKFASWQNRDNFQAERIVGRFDEAHVLAQIPTDVNKTSFLISGPTLMGRHWIKTLVDHGVPRDRIFYEEFGW